MCLEKSQSLKKYYIERKWKAFEGDSSYFRVARRAHEELERENIQLFISDISHRVVQGHCPDIATRTQPASPVVNHFS